MSTVDAAVIAQYGDHITGEIDATGHEIGIYIPAHTACHIDHACVFGQSGPALVAEHPVFNLSIEDAHFSCGVEPDGDAR